MSHFSKSVTNLLIEPFHCYNLSLFYLVLHIIRPKKRKLASFMEPVSFISSTVEIIQQGPFPLLPASGQAKRLNGPINSLNSVLSVYLWSHAALGMFCPSYPSKAVCLIRYLTTKTNKQVLNHLFWSRYSSKVHGYFTPCHQWWILICVTFSLLMVNLNGQPNIGKLLSLTILDLLTGCRSSCLSGTWNGFS